MDYQNNLNDWQPEKSFENYYDKNLEQTSNTDLNDLIYPGASMTVLDYITPQGAYFLIYSVPRMEVHLS